MFTIKHRSTAGYFDAIDHIEDELNNSNNGDWPQLQLSVAPKGKLERLEDLPGASWTFRSWSKVG